jgi:hypothetical protein
MMKATQKSIKSLVQLVLVFVLQGILATGAKVTAVIDSVHLRAETPSRPKWADKSIDIDILFQRSASLVSSPLSTGRKESLPKKYKSRSRSVAEFLL